MGTVAVIGGRLQGTEAAYLLKKGGMCCILVDQCKDVPASGLCDIFFCGEVCGQSPELLETLQQADFILPATENQAALDALLEISRKIGVPAIYDPPAYKITSSKQRTDALMHKNGIPSPVYYPGGSPPYVIKPSAESGSAGVRKASSAAEVEEFLGRVDFPEKWVVQEYLEGRSFSIEVIGVPGNYKTYTVTEIHVDAQYDCCRVSAAPWMQRQHGATLGDIATRLAEMVRLHGVMDVEVVEDNGALKVLEIDARLPSQTPMAVFHATGVNLLCELSRLVKGMPQDTQPASCRHTSLEHILIGPEQVVCCGEHIMAQAGPLKIIHGFFGADEALCDYTGPKAPWRGTFLVSANNAVELQARREAMYQSLEQSLTAN